MDPESKSRGCTGEKAKIFFSSDDHETCQGCRCKVCDHITSKYWLKNDWKVTVLQVSCRKRISM